MNHKISDGRSEEINPVDCENNGKDNVEFQASSITRDAKSEWSLSENHLLRGMKATYDGLSW